MRLLRIPWWCHSVFSAVTEGCGNVPLCGAAGTQAGGTGLGIESATDATTQSCLVVTRVLVCLRGHWSCNSERLRSSCPAWVDRAVNRQRWGEHQANWLHAVVGGH